MIMSKVVSVKYLFLFTFIAIYLVDQPTPVVRLEQGLLSGRISRNGEVFEYLGIPYGTSNHETRFQAPLPPPSWDGIYKAIEECFHCPQLILGMVLGDEDCLKLNVYVPAKTKKPLPVMVYIHGGGFLIGSGSYLTYGPNFFVKHDVILVTMNYRLGSLGFVCLGIKEAPGNAGLRDQVAALRWVKNNIAAFGGDPDNITIFGESAGAASTSILVASNVTNGLFNRAIIQSGSFMANWAISRNPILASSLLAKELGYNTTDPRELYNIFKNTSYKELISNSVTRPWEKYFEIWLMHLPCIEKPFDGQQVIVSDLPYNVLTTANKKNISVITGFNDKEGLFLIYTENEESLRRRNDGYTFASDLSFETDEEAFAVTKKVNKVYFGDEPISINNKLSMGEVYTDLSFAIPGMLETDAMCSNSNCNVYNYYFKYDGSRNIIKYLIGYYYEPGAAHGDELFYMFDSKFLPFWITKDDQLIIDRLSKLWTNFAKYNNPTPEITNDLPIKWQPSTKNELKFLYIDKELKMGPNPRQDSYLLWKDIYTRYHRKKWSY